uniref:Uncharacterized protein n=1 Tax=Solanum lycopersicum TaxID=4081 RepID=A0A3Q7IV96_SOLLC
MFLDKSIVSKLQPAKEVGTIPVGKVSNRGGEVSGVLNFEEVYGSNTTNLSHAFACRPTCPMLLHILTEHSRWDAFKGESTDEKDLLFTIKKTSIFQWKTKLAVFLANNNSKGNWSIDHV